MSWLNNLSETYDACQAAVLAGNTEQGNMLLPLGHALKQSDVVFYLDIAGSFLSAEKTSAKICTPCTDESESRTSGAKDTPNPLFDQLKHVVGKKYLENLSKWQEFLKQNTGFPVALKMISAVFTYISAGNLKSDLEKSKILPEDKLFIRFCVDIQGYPENRLWMVPELWQAWVSFFMLEIMNNRNTKDLCYISGEPDLPFTLKHPKSINRAAGNAKLITSNDNQNFTFRGRFTDPTQAVTVSYEESQKAHQTLRWLIENYSYRCDTQAITAWAIDRMPDVPAFYNDSEGFYKSLNPAELPSDQNNGTVTENIIYADYAALLKKTLLTYKSAEKLKHHRRRIAILATDNATTGRLSVTYYRELAENEYFEGIIKWHDTCCWFQPYHTDEDGRFKLSYFIGAPSFDRIVVAVLGKKRSAKDQSYDKLKKTLRERLLHSLFDGEHIPLDIVKASVNRSSNPLALENTGSNSPYARWRDWEQVLCTSCALVKKYYYDYEKEDIDMALEVQRRDRDYLYGRLLAVADKIESTARFKQGVEKEGSRATNAIRYMTTFAQRPYRTWHMLFTQQLNPYIQQLKGAGWYLNQVEEIMLLFNDGEFESDKSLDGKYLLGYFAQRQVLRQRKETGDENSKNGGENYESVTKN